MSNKTLKKVTAKKRKNLYITKTKAPKVVSLFSGCGGLDYGFQKAGYEIIYANDIEKSVKNTYEYNLKHSIDICDIRSIDKNTIPDGDIILAGLPCQPFSNAGNRSSTKHADGNLFLQVLDVINNQVKPPSVVVFENVKGFLSSRDSHGLLMTTRFEQEMSKHKYSTKYKLLNASNYGVPSNRERVFIVCISKNLKKDFSFPEPNILKRKITVGDVISKPLPKGEKPEIWALPEHYSEIIKYIKEGGSWKDIPYNKLFDRHKRIRDNMEKYRSPNFYRRFSREEVMGTITATSTPENSGIIHPLETRRYSVREIARFQSFPDKFKFIDTSIQKKYKMIGNSVPPKLAQALAKSILEQIFNG